MENTRVPLSPLLLEIIEGFLRKHGKAYTGFSPESGVVIPLVALKAGEVRNVQSRGIAQIVVIASFEGIPTDYEISKEEAAKLSLTYLKVGRSLISQEGDYSTVSVRLEVAESFLTEFEATFGGIAKTGMPSFDAERAALLAERQALDSRLVLLNASRGKYVEEVYQSFEDQCIKN